MMKQRSAGCGPSWESGNSVECGPSERGEYGELRAMRCVYAGGILVYSVSSLHAFGIGAAAAWYGVPAGWEQRVTGCEERRGLRHVVHYRTTVLVLQHWYWY